MALWHYLRLAPGKFRQLSATFMEKFHNGEASFPPDDRGYVEAITFWIELTDRKPTGRFTDWVSKYPLLADGRYDGERALGTIARLTNISWEKAGGAAGHWILPSGHTKGVGVIRPLGETQENVVAAEHLFEERKLEHAREWKVLPEDVEALRALVTARAGRLLF